MSQPVSSLCGSVLFEMEYQKQTFRRGDGVLHRPGNRGAEAATEEERNPQVGSFCGQRWQNVRHH